jgi:16S rRNA (cytosine1402-N4)-methyltransferase
MEKQIHVPVLLSESLEYLVYKKDGIYFDGTLGFGGHFGEILNSTGSKSKVVGVDKDVNAFNYCFEKFNSDNRAKIYNAAFTDIDIISKIEFIDKYDGIFADLGVSSFQLDEADSGFTYREDAVLDLRMNKKQGLPAYHHLNILNQEEIANIIYKYGEEKKSRLIAQRIVEFRLNEKITRTGQLRDIVSRIVPQRFQAETLSRVFQALRIFVNNELDELEIFLTAATDRLKTGGRLVIISYHSLEDRIVKDSFKYENLECICPPKTPVCICGKKRRLNILTKKPVTPSEGEIEINRRSRSAKLRAAERT